MKKGIFIIIIFLSHNAIAQVTREESLQDHMNNLFRELNSLGIALKGNENIHPNKVRAIPDILDTYFNNEIRLKLPNNLKRGYSLITIENYLNSIINSFAKYGINFHVKEAIISEQKSTSNFYYSKYLVRISINGRNNEGIRINRTDWLQFYIKHKRSIKEENIPLASMQIKQIKYIPKDSLNTDNDSILNIADDCPYQDGFKCTDGCPDKDNDCVRDSRDSCLNTYGTKETDGCPDNDKDSISNHLDDCPNIAGVECTKGCPDRDGDCVRDSLDNCPNTPGHPSANGCPDDDEDGIVNLRDTCPKVAGLARFNGCPDNDNDGIAYPKDKCDNQAAKTLNGCPTKINLETFNKHTNKKNYLIVGGGSFILSAVTLPFAIDNTNSINTIDETLVGLANIQAREELLTQRMSHVNNAKTLYTIGALTGLGAIGTTYFYLRKRNKWQKGEIPKQYNKLNYQVSPTSVGFTLDF